MASHKDHIAPRPRWVNSAYGLAEDPLAPRPKRRVSQFFAGNKGNATRWVASIWCLSCQQHKERRAYSSAGSEDRVDLPRGLDGVQSDHHRPPYTRLNAEALAPLGATRGKNGTATLGGHTGTEAMGLGTLPSIRLVCTLHYSYSS